MSLDISHAFMRLYLVFIDFFSSSGGRVRVKKTKSKRVKVDGVFVPWNPGQRTMATAGRTKINTNIEKGHFGPVPGIEVGQSWQYRIQLSENGVHAPPGEIFSPIRCLYLSK